jgi:tRNA (guanine37-N1)-methyltransferase
MCEPIFDAIESIRTKDSYIILMTPDGKPYNQSITKELSTKKHLIIICGHYEGFDERIRSLVDEEISIGDFVLTGGEIPAMAITDSIIRLIPGVITTDSLASESFNDNLLDYPVYTKPREYKEMVVPEVLLSGNHEKIALWRKEERIRRTEEKRPDLIK